MTPAWDDLDQFIDPDDFGVWAVVTFQAGGTRRIPALFDDPAAGIRYERRLPTAPAAALGDYDMDMEHPRIHATLANLAGVKRRDSVQFEQNGVLVAPVYGVLTSPKQDGSGMGYVCLVAEP